MTSLPRLKVEPERYAAEWFIGERSVPGEIELRGFLPPVIEVFGDIEQIDWAAPEGQGLPITTSSSICERVGRLGRFPEHGPKPANIRSIFIV